MSVMFTLTGAEQMKATLAKLGADAPRAAGAALYQEAERIMARAKEMTPVDMGPLWTSGHVQLPKLTATAATVVMGFGGAAAPYALYVHEGIGPAVGRPAFMPPSNVLEGWVRRNIGGSAADIKRIAFLVARVIGRRGLRPTKFLERAVFEARAGFEQRVARRLQAWIARPRVGA